MPSLLERCSMAASVAWRRGVAVTRALIGAPDYDRYLAHLDSHHPGSTPLGRADFFAQRQAARFARGATRCC